ncbi:fatty acid synthase alpha subunit Lsd1 [Tilletia horrida]|nr:fatty acid synthase alpha subunit Lsd1 [Tilletia horrida]
MFLSAASRQYVEEIAAEGHPERCLSFEANFLGMVLPGDVLTVRLRHIAMRSGHKALPALLKQMTPEEVREKLIEIVTEIFKAALEEGQKGPISLQRGFATIPLAGIDVPFHSAYLTGGVTPFRAYLSKGINVENLDPAKLRLRYIPNLVAASFETSKAYAEFIFAQTDSVRLGKALANWDRDGWATLEKEQQLTALLLIDLFLRL